MFKYLLLKTIYDISDVDVVERSQYDMSFKYFLGMAPEEGVINPCSLCKFRKIRLKDMDLLTLLIKKTVSLAVEKESLLPRQLLLMRLIQHQDPIHILPWSFSNFVASN